MNEHRSRFKAYLLSPLELPQKLRAESEGLAPYLIEYRQQYLNGYLSAAEWAALFIMTFLESRQPGRWWMKKRRDGTGEERGETLRRRDFLNHWLTQFEFKKLPDSIGRALYRWNQKTYGLILKEEMITPYQMLQAQAQGVRIATLAHNDAVAGNFVDGQRDALEFLLHDLVHADLFFHHREKFMEQQSFFQSLLRLLEQGFFTQELELDAEFQKDFNYLISDMNSHPAHLASLLKASYIKHLLVREGKQVTSALSLQSQSELQEKISQWQQRGDFTFALASIN